jgi:predicted nucleic acid-binding Zn ribbon protein
MTKTQAIQLFGGRFRHLAGALNISVSAVSQWPEELTQRQTDLVLGAAVRLGKLPVDVSRFLGQAVAQNHSGV